MTSAERNAARRIGLALAAGRSLTVAFRDNLEGDVLRMRAQLRLKQQLGCDAKKAEELVEEILTP